MTLGPTIRRRVLVGGEVQGVFFRETCRRHAQRAGVAGWVKNRPDGRVEAVFEGPAQAVGHMVDWCRNGPPSAAVAGVEIHEEEPRGESGFKVRH